MIDVTKGVTDDFVASFTNEDGSPKVDTGPFFRLLCKNAIRPVGLDVFDPRVRKIILAACEAGGWESPYGEE